MAYRRLHSVYYEDRAAYERLYQQRLDGESTYRTAFTLENGEPVFAVLTPSLHAAAIAIHEANRRLLACHTALPGTALTLFTRRLIVEEVEQTLDIERVESTRRELMDALEAARGKAKSMAKPERALRLEGIVRRYQMLSAEEKDMVALRTPEDVRRIYDELCLPEVVEENPGNAPDGELFRKNEVYVAGKREKPLHTGLLPESKIIMKVQGALEMARDEAIDPLVRAALFHLCLEYIHPFYDGNGRLGRYIASVQLAEALGNPLIGLRLSYTLHAHAQAYYKLFRDALDPLNRGDATEFALKFLGFVREALEALGDTLEARLAQHRRVADHIDERIGNGSTRKAADVLAQAALFGGGSLRVDDLQALSGLSRATVDKALKTLQDAGLAHAEKSGRHTDWRLDVDALENQGAPPPNP